MIQWVTAKQPSQELLLVCKDNNNNNNNNFVKFCQLEQQFCHFLT